MAPRRAFFLAGATYNKIVNNVFDDNAADSLSLVNSDYNLVEGNDFRKAEHAIWDIRCGDYNVIRRNTFHNESQKIGEIYDCDGASGYTDFDATKRNVIEDNDFAYVPSSGNASPFSGIQFAGQDTIIRRNRFYDLVGPGIRMAIYGAEARYNTGNRIYHNVFYGTDFAGVRIAAGNTMSDNVLKNNIFMKSAFVANDTRWNWWVNTVTGKPVQVMADRLDGFTLDNNVFFSSMAGEPWIITYGGRTTSWAQQENVTWWESNYTQLVSNSIEVDPEFVDEANRNFRLVQTSPAVDSGGFLTRVVGADTNATVVVEDASYFYDGYGIEGVVGDVIRLEGQPDSAVVLSVDYANNTLTLDQPLSFTDGQGVALNFTGTAPDIGAYEFGMDDCTGDCTGAGGGGAGAGGAGGDDSGGQGGCDQTANCDRANGGSETAGQVDPASGCACTVIGNSPTDPRVSWLAALALLGLLGIRSGSHRRRSLSGPYR